MTWRLVRTDTLQLVQLFVLTAAVVRGVDYLITPPGSSEVLNLIERAAPLWLWASVFIAFGLLGLAGEWWMSFGISTHRWIASYIAHAGLVALYLAVGLGALSDVLDRNPPYGFRTPMEWMFIAAVHAIFVRRRERV
ncbi:membrane protein [Mycobacterium phage IdentityCrisis]|uniref:Membrane protein n=1 Tax=Mycobacterium phage IdentityCrisis TaxID=2599866 RepID=A0A5J6TI19_9CAUD|nr:membrane protein [Mycobacterium phage IdentityCrisis]QFG10048.1 membrane protein [Mycobacterium phage IdentityCrisis]